MLKKYGFQELNDLYAAVGYGGLASIYVVTRLLEEQRLHEAPIPKQNLRSSPPRSSISSSAPRRPRASSWKGWRASRCALALLQPGTWG